jgi:fumarylacetoacetase
MGSWIDTAADSDFPIQNLPYCVFSADCGPRVGTRIGDSIVDLEQLYDVGLLRISETNPFAADSLNQFMSLGRQVWRETRRILNELLSEGSPKLRDDSELRSKAILGVKDASLHLPVRIGAFVDFYSSEQHATNVGKMLRPDNPLMPNWKHLPVGYNGRASSVVVSGTPVRRPNGQTMPQGVDVPVYGPSKNLDFELEMGFFAGKANPLGEQVSANQAEEFVFGMVLVNDWSARDIQRWEYQPLGPFLSKSFATTISPYVVTMDALEPFRIAGPEQAPAVLPYLQCAKPWHYDIDLTIDLKTEKMSKPQTVCRSNYKYMYWSLAQQLAHQCVNGTNVQVGDLYASGTISGDTPDSYGSMLELSWRGEKPVVMDETGEERKFLHDGDEVTLTGCCYGDGYRIGFGECSGVIMPAR